MLQTKKFASDVDSFVLVKASPASIVASAANACTVAAQQLNSFSFFDARCTVLKSRIVQENN